MATRKYKFILLKDPDVSSHQSRGLSIQVNGFAPVADVNGEIGNFLSQGKVPDIAELVASDDVVLLFRDEHLNIAVHAIVLAGITLACNINDHTILYASRDVYLNNLLAKNNALAVTFLTLLLDDSTLATTSRTRALCLHHSKDALL